LMEGDHPIGRCEEVTQRVLQTVFDHLFAARIFLEGMVLKPNMVIAGKKSAQKSSPEQVAEATVRTLKRHVPSAVAGIAFLSGGQSPTEATLNLSLINAAGGLPWPVTFSYGRALQDTALRAWGGNDAGFQGGQKQLYQRAKLNGLAAGGTYKPSMETAA
jgi:fructose-bisphosphate aldolase, class I